MRASPGRSECPFVRYADAQPGTKSVRASSPCGGIGAVPPAPREGNMDSTTLLIIIILVLLIFGGGWYGRGRWF